MRKILAIILERHHLRFTGLVGVAVLPDPADRLHRGPGRRHRRRRAIHRIRLVVVGPGRLALSQPS